MSLNAAGALAMTDQQVPGGSLRPYQPEKKAGEVAARRMGGEYEFPFNFPQPAYSKASLQYQQITEADVCKAEKNVPT